MNVNEVQIQNLLAEHAEALLAGTADLDVLLASYGIPRDSRAAQLLLIAERIYAAMPEVKPSPEFVQQLYEELIGSVNTTLLERLRHLQIDFRQLQLDLQTLGLTLPNLQNWQLNLPNLQQWQQVLPNLPIDRPIDRFRHMPRHYQLVAGLTLAGVVWIAARVGREGLYSFLAPTPSTEADASKVEISA
jgi:hypothetical protein